MVTDKIIEGLVSIALILGGMGIGLLFFSEDCPDCNCSPQIVQQETIKERIIIKEKSNLNNNLTKCNDFDKLQYECINGMREYEWYEKEIGR